MRRYSEAIKADVRRRMSPPMRQSVAQIEVGAFYWTVLAPDIVNSGREEQGLVSV